MIMIKFSNISNIFFWLYVFKIPVGSCKLTAKSVSDKCVHLPLCIDQILTLLVIKVGQKILEISYTNP